MPIVDSSHWTSKAARVRVASTAASWSATPTTVSGTSQSTGLR